MYKPLELFPPFRSSGLKRLHDFVPHAGRAYAAERNTDTGLDLRENVSMLSPYIRYRMITEHEVVAAVLEQHMPAQAEKFIQEVFWRTYWKGWLQLRPQVWADFLAERDQDRQRVEKGSSLATVLADAEAGRTGIDCFDDWACELIQTGYLHNHARMWFASIWIFTLKLPWTLGADFFLRHLIDADPASNTLSWRWVAGIQTRGKTYLARPDNIAKYTNGKYQPIGLATEALPIRDEVPYPAQSLMQLQPIEPSEPAVLILHPEDFCGVDHVPGAIQIVAVVIAFDAGPKWPHGQQARSFVHAATEDIRQHSTEWLDQDVSLIDRFDASTLLALCKDAGVNTIVTPDAPVGPIDTTLTALADSIARQGIQLHRYRRDWDAAAWPQATKGFFPFKKAIPKLLTRAGLV